MKTIILFCILLSNALLIQAQQLPQLTHQQMLADFDTLTVSLTKINPHQYVRQKVNHYSQTDSILALRQSVDTITTTQTFFWLVNKALTFCQDGHTSVLRKYFYTFIDSLDAQKWHSSLSDTNTIQQYTQLYKSETGKYKLKLPIKYIDGEYITLSAFTYGSSTIPKKAVITHCNSQGIHKYVNSLTGSLKEMHWDFTNKRFYSENFTQSLNLKPNQTIGLTFSTGNKTINQVIKLSDTVQLAGKLKYIEPFKPAVQYFASDGLLYIRMPVMRNGDYYITQIDSIARLHTFRKVVIDIRDNPGGSDPEWQSILRHLIDKPIIRNITRCSNFYNPRRDRFYTNIKPNSYTNKFIPERTYSLVSNEADTLTVDPKSIHYTGNIYVLQNENCFSSAGSLISTCQFSDKLINVGNSTGWFAGFGSMPWVMILPNSKILYWTEPLLDFTQVNKPGDFFHNDVKIKVALSADDYARKYTYTGSWYDKDYLFTYDKAFREILSLR